MRVSRALARVLTPANLPPNPFIREGWNERPPPASATLRAGRPRSHGAKQARKRGRGETDDHRAIIPRIFAPLRQISLASAICQHALTTNN